MKKPIFFTAAMALTLGIADPVMAGGCNSEVVEHVRFETGATCWYYAGKATHFVGKLSKGQRVTVEMKGEL
jgi:hypothetical protein